MTSQTVVDSIHDMEITRDNAATRAAVRAARRAGRRIGFVPTMGALHRAHLSLVRAARDAGDYVVVSIFVNPTQFGPNEDYEAYPRDEAADLSACEHAGVDLVFIPSAEVMYPPGSVTTVHVSRLTETLCGPHRPGHFEGVTTVVSKLFNIVQADAAYFGQKDAQQLAVIKRMARDLDMPIEIVGCPTVREEDGVAMSSRNAYLNDAQRVQARCLHRALREAAALIAGGQIEPDAVVGVMRKLIDDAGPASIDYISVVDPESMQPVDRIDRPVLVALAVRIGSTRLIDNLQVDPPSSSR